LIHRRDTGIECRGHVEHPEAKVTVPRGRAAPQPKHVRQLADIEVRVLGEEQCCRARDDRRGE
jgi:hypothetical protein